MIRNPQVQQFLDHHPLAALRAGGAPHGGGINPPLDTADIPTSKHMNVNTAGRPYAVAAVRAKYIISFPRSCGSRHTWKAHRPDLR